VAFSLEASKLSWRWDVLINMTNKWIEVICKYELCSVSVTNGDVSVTNSIKFNMINKLNLILNNS
jgi:hypothetical protein